MLASGHPERSYRNFRGAKGAVHAVCFMQIQVLQGQVHLKLPLWWQGSVLNVNHSSKHVNFLNSLSGASHMEPCGQLESEGCQKNVCWQFSHAQELRLVKEARVGQLTPHLFVQHGDFVVQFGRSQK